MTTVFSTILREHPTLSQIVPTWRIVIVDDEPDSVDILVRLLTSLGATTYTAQNGQQALSLIRSVMPTFVICDLSMRDMDGWALKASLDEDAALKCIPVIALTAHAMPGDRQRTLDAGFDLYYAKPIDLVEFVLTVAHWMGGSGGSTVKHIAKSSYEM